MKERIKEEQKQEYNRKIEQQKQNEKDINSEINSGIKSIETTLNACKQELNKLNKKKKLTNDAINDKKHLEFMIEFLGNERTMLEQIIESNKPPEKEVKEAEKIPLTVNMSNGIYYATNLTCTAEILNEYDIVGFDMGNTQMVDYSSESCIHSLVNKMEYYDLAHILADTKLMQEMMRECVYQIKDKNGKVTGMTSIEQINTELSLNTYKTTDIDKYMKYVKIIRKYWDIVWDFNSQKSILNRKFSASTYKQKAIAEIVQRIIKKLKNKDNIDKYRKNEFSEDKINKPKLIAFGMGNGTMTISNTKGSSPKESINMLIKELSKHFSSNTSIRRIYITIVL